MVVVQLHLWQASLLFQCQNQVQNRDQEISSASNLIVYSSSES